MEFILKKLFFLFFIFNKFVFCSYQDNFFHKNITMSSNNSIKLFEKIEFYIKNAVIDRESIISLLKNDFNRGLIKIENNKKEKDFKNFELAFNKKLRLFFLSFYLSEKFKKMIKCSGYNFNTLIQYNKNFLEPLIKKYENYKILKKNEFSVNFNSINIQIIKNYENFNDDDCYYKNFCELDEKKSDENVFTDSFGENFRFCFYQKNFLKKFFREIIIKNKKKKHLDSKTLILIKECIVKEIINENLIYNLLENDLSENPKEIDNKGFSIKNYENFEDFFFENMNLFFLIFYLKKNSVLCQPKNKLYTNFIKIIENEEYSLFFDLLIEKYRENSLYCNEILKNDSSNQNNNFDLIKETKLSVEEEEEEQLIEFFDLDNSSDGFHKYLNNSKTSKTKENSNNYFPLNEEEESENINFYLNNRKINSKNLLFNNLFCLDSYFSEELFK